MAVSTDFVLWVGLPDKDEMVSGELCRGKDIVEFRFSEGAVKECADALRRDAREWAAKCKPKYETRKEAFQKLRESSLECFTEIFKHAARSIPDFLAQAEGDANLVVRQQSTRLRIPWSLLSDPNGSDDSAPFWGIKYNVYIYALGPQGNDPSPQPWAFGSAFHDDVFFQAKMALKPVEQSFAEAVHARRTLVEKFRPRVSPPADAPRCCFVYVHAHGEKGDLVFAPDGNRVAKVRPDRLLDAFIQRDGVAILMLNACNTTESLSNLAESLMAPRTNREVACIVTEYPVDNEFAMRVGLELIDRCVQLGESTVEAMKAIRRRHQPSSIVYELYCKSALTVVPTHRLLDDSTANEYRSSIKDTNFSLMQAQ